MATGRKNKYKTHIEPHLALVKQMRIDGHTEIDIRKRLGVGNTAWYEYKRDYTEFAEALKYSKETLIAKLEDTLFQQALKGNTTALIFSLKNLAPQKWGEKVDVSGNIKMSEFNKSIERMMDKL